MRLKDKYEISIWEDYLANPTDAYYSEKKIATIGSNTTTAQWRAINPNLVENINGTNTFTFKMYYVYTDTETGEKVQNPFIKLLVNERKVKVNWKNKWYDFIIKNISENSGDKSITYTCKDLYVNELSKTGFDLTFSNELMNNSGTVQELGARIVEGTDWAIQTGDTIQQKIEEPVFEVQTSANIITKEGITIPSGAKILLFYSVQQGGRPVQIWYDPDQKYLKENGSMLVTSGSCYTFSNDRDYNNIVFSEILTISEQYRAKRLVQTQKTIYDKLVDRYVSLYSDGTNTYRSFISTDTDTPVIVPNLISNGKNFANLDTWIVIGGDGTPTFGLRPAYDNTISIETYFNTANSYIILPRNTAIANSCLNDNTMYLPNGLQKNQTYILRYKAYINSINGNNLMDDTFFRGGFKEGTFKKSDNINLDDEDNIKNNIFTLAKNEIVGEWRQLTLKVKKPITRSELLINKYQLVFEFDNPKDVNLYIKEIEFFEKKTDENGNLLVPNSIDTSAVIKTYKKFYNPNENQSAIDNNNPDEIVYGYICKSDEDWEVVKPIYNDNYEKIRSIEASKTNRFDIIQTLAETFECWARFNIEHEENGATKIVNGVPQKTITFVEAIGQKTGLGFTYGLDLKTISRTIASDQISTKVIVSNNSNEYGKNGFCSIARSSENYPKENFILNFDYYINQGLLDGGQLNKDLYLSATIGSNDIGYYPSLKTINAQYDHNSELLTQYKLTLDKQGSIVTVYKELISSTEEEKTALGADIASFSGINSLSSTQLANIDDEKMKSWLITYNQLTKSLEVYKTYLTNAEKVVNDINESIKFIEEEQETLLKQKEELHKRFNTRYSNYIQEGTWISEDYTDDNLYYLDAQSVAYTSSRPQISYNISVMRLSAIEEFKNRVFKLGDIGFIQDVEFFGYEITADGDSRYKTPYREQILISEVTSNFDEPEKDVFKVQNYKTQFEDLFQRITATTQNLQFHSGEYQKVANIVDSNGVIKAETFQASIANNSSLVWDSINDVVSTDNTGVTVRDASNVNKIVKLTSGGLFISTDGGVTWKNAVRGEGVSTRWLTAGKINVNDITIYSDTGTYPTFRWDGFGLNAYDLYTTKNEETGEVTITGTNANKFVRFDRFGIYGRNGTEEAISFIPESEDEIWTDSYVKYALTWKGFMFNTDGGAVKITSQDDIGVYATNEDNPRIKIGRIGGNITDGYTYGIKISDASGATVMETNDDGSLWLKNGLNVETYNSNTKVGIGKLDTEDTKDAIHGGRIIDANGKFVVYEDGRIVAASGSFTGEINATSGKIGNMTIGEVEDATMKVVVTSDDGTTFKGWDQTKTLTAGLYKGNTLITGNVTYQWYKDNNILNGEKTSTLIIKNVEGDPLDVYTCEITYEE